MSMSCHLHNAGKIKILFSKQSVSHIALETGNKCTTISIFLMFLNVSKCSKLVCSTFS